MSRPGTRVARPIQSWRCFRLDPEKAEIWLDASSLVAGIKMLLGVDPKPDYKDKVAQVSLRG